MFSDISVIAIVFRFLNLFALLAVIAYVFKKYLLDSIKAMRAERIAQRTLLQEESDALKGAVRELDKVIEQEAAACEHLKKQVMAWRTRVERELEKQEAHKHEQAEKVAAMWREKSDNVHKEILEHKIVPHAVEQAREELERTFANQATGTQFVKEVVDQLHKSRK